MKNTMYLSFIILCILASCKSAPDSDDASISSAKEETKMNSGETYVADAGASKIEWIGTKVSGYHSGTVKLKSGELQVKGNDLAAGNFVLNMSSIAATGPEKVSAQANGKLTGHLHSADFFDTGKYPEATFTITGVKPVSETIEEPDDPRQEKLSVYKVTNPTHTLSGNLTIKGISKNIEFPALIKVEGNNIEARAKLNIDRKQWDVVYEGEKDDLIRDEIHLGILLIAKK